MIMRPQHMGYGVILSYVTEGLSPDIMHDILEGALQYETKELIKYLVTEQEVLT